MLSAILDGLGTAQIDGELADIVMNVTGVAYSGTSLVVFSTSFTDHG